MSACTTVRSGLAMRCKDATVCCIVTRGGTPVLVSKRLKGSESARTEAEATFFFSAAARRESGFLRMLHPRCKPRKVQNAPRLGQPLALWPGLLIARRVTPDAPPSLYPHPHGRAHAGQRTWTHRRLTASAPTPTALGARHPPLSPFVRFTPRKLCVAFDGLAGSAACRRTRAPNLLLLQLPVRRRRFLRIFHRYLTAAVRSVIVTAFALHHADRLRKASRNSHFGRSFVFAGRSVCFPSGRHHPELVV